MSLFRINKIAVLALALLAGVGAAGARDATQPPPWLPGVNLDAGSFGPSGTRLGTDYTYPTTEEIDYFTEKGFKVFRIPFLAKRVLRSDADGHPKPTVDFSILTKLIDHAASKDAMVILDMHDYGRTATGKLIGRDPGSVEEFAESWETIAALLAGRQTLMFGLMNEPNEQTAAEWLEGANAAVAAIRRAGARQLVLVPGSHWDTARTWTTTDNKKVMLGFQDPADNFAFEVHQYLDGNSSGTHAQVVTGSGSKRLTAFTEWARKHGVRGFLGEFGWADNAAAHKEGRALLCAMASNRDVWLGWTYWAAGPWWGDYMFSIEPANGEDRPQLKVLTQFLESNHTPQC